MTRGRRIRVLVAEDSLTVRRRLVEILSADPELEVAGEAANGREAITLCEALRPDVVTMDMMMPELSGLAATEQIMAYCPTPILVVSGSLDRGEAFRTLDALAAGAVDVLDKPSGDEPAGGWEQKLRAAVKLCSRIKVIRHLRGRTSSASPAPEPSPLPPPELEPPIRVVAIGASTGGPGALMQILGELPRDFPAPLLVVIHLNEAFQPALVEWLGAHSRLAVRHPRDGDPIPERDHPAVLLAPPGRHLEVDGERIRLTTRAERNFCRPSVDVLFESLARQRWARQVIACLLTGLGRDGAEGLLALHRAGATTLVQDEATSSIFGMPREAIALGAARLVLPIDLFAPTLAQLASDP